MRTYDVNLVVSGKVTVRRPIHFNTEKELDFGNVFRSEVSIKKDSQGFTISSTVFTADQDRAHKVALLFVGKMLDVLSMTTNLPLAVSLTNVKVPFDNSFVKAVIDAEEFQFCFSLARELNLHEDRLLRAFSWYRKGLYTEDPFDKFLAFWNSICVVAEGYCDDTERTRLGIINKIWDCFSTIWGTPLNWPHIQGEERWINENNTIRNLIAHGGVTVDVRYVENVINRLDMLQTVAYQFLKEWTTRLNWSLEYNPHG